MSDYIALAKSLDAKLDQSASGLWRVLDMPGTVLWQAWFLDEQTAAWAYCFQRGLAR